MKTFTTFISSSKIFAIVLLLIISGSFTFVSIKNTQFEEEIYHAASGIQVSTELVMSSNIKELVSSGTSSQPRGNLQKNKTEPEEKTKQVEKVWRGVVETIDSEKKLFILKVGNRLVSAGVNASTTFYTGKEEVAEIEDISVGTRIYTFGYVNHDNSVMTISKIIISNRSKMLRK